MIIKSGEIIRFNYSGENATDPTPTVLFLDKYQGYVHGLKLDNLTVTEKRHYYRLFKTKYANKSISPKTFYKREIQGKIKNDAYRTYLPKYMSNVKIIKNVVIRKKIK